MSDLLDRMTAAESILGAKPGCHCLTPQPAQLVLLNDATGSRKIVICVTCAGYRWAGDAQKPNDAVLTASSYSSWRGLSPGGSCLPVHLWRAGDALFAVIRNGVVVCASYSCHTINAPCSVVSTSDLKLRR